MIVILSLQAIVDANQVTFVKLQGKVYVETDANHYAMYGQVADKDGTRVVVVNDNDHHYVTSKCDHTWEDLREIDKRRVEDYGKVRENNLKVQTKSRAETGVYSDTYLWSDTYSDKPTEWSATVLGEDTVAITSKYFPPKLAKVIACGPIVIFIHVDGSIRMKTVNCLQPNEQNLLDGLRTINYNDDKKKSFFSTSADEKLRKYIKKNPIDEYRFYNEQDYMTTFTKGQLQKMQFSAGGTVIDNGRGGDTL